MRLRTCLALLLVAVTLPVVGSVSPAAAGPVAALEAATSVIRTEAAFRRAWADPMRRRIDLGADIVLRNCRVGDPIRESPYPLVLDGHGHTIRQSCFEKRLLRQDGTGYLDVHDIALTPRRLRRSRRGAHLARRDLARGLRDHPEPRGGAGRRRLLDAPGHRAPLPHQRQPRQRRRRRDLRPPRRRAGLRLGAEQQPRRRLGRRDRLDRRHPRRALEDRRQHHRRRRRRALRRRGRRRDRHRLAHRRQRRGRAGRRDLHPGRRRRGARVDADRQPRRRPRRRDLRRGRRAGRQLQRSPATSPSPTPAAASGRAAT